MKTFMDNEMTYQLGNIMYAFQRDVKPEVAVERGKKFLDAMDFIGFYEDFSIRRTREKGPWYYKNHSFEPSRYLQIKWVQDAVLVPTCPHMASQNAPNQVLEASWSLLEPSWGPLGPSWRHLEDSWRHLGASWTYLGASWPILEASWGLLEGQKSTDTAGSGRGGGVAAATPRKDSGRIRN